MEFNETTNRLSQVMKKLDIYFADKNNSYHESGKKLHDKLKMELEKRKTGESNFLSLQQV
ncbi:MAG: hypothetical protein LBC92_01600 [Rickettsiales bacterium]|nr:hypothetical protein [Rickettsiales bacterium]